MKTVLIVFTLVFALLFLFVEGGFGALRGWKKELIRVGVLLAVGVLVFFLAPGFAKKTLVRIANVIDGLDRIASIPDISYRISESFGIDVSFIGPIVEKILTIVASLMIPFLFVGIFWIAKILSWPLFALAWMIIKKIRCSYAGNHPAENQTPDQAMEELSNRYRLDGKSRLIGAGIGVVLGIFVGALSFMPLAQYSRLPEAFGRDNIALLTTDEVADTICFWSKAPAGYLYRYTGTEQLFGMVFQSLSTVDVGGHEYKAKHVEELVELVPDIIEVADAFDAFEDKDWLEEQEKEELLEVSLSELAPTMKSLVHDLFGMEIFTEKEKKSAVNFFVNEGLKSSAGTDKIVNSTLSSIKEMSIGELEEELCGLVDLAVVMDDNGLFSEGGLDSFEVSVLSDRLIDDATDAIYKLQLSEAVLPAAIDMIMESVLSNLHVEVVPVEEIKDFNHTKEQFKELLRLLKQAFVLVENKARMTGVAQVREALNGISKLKDSPFISPQTYKNLEDKLLKDAIANNDMKETVKTAVKDQIEELKNTTGSKEIDDEIIESVQEVVDDFLGDFEKLDLDLVDQVVTKLDNGTLLDGIEETSVLDSIRNGEFDLHEWMKD